LADWRQHRNCPETGLEEANCDSSKPTWGPLVEKTFPGLLPLIFDLFRYQRVEVVFFGQQSERGEKAILNKNLVPVLVRTNTDYHWHLDGDAGGDLRSSYHGPGIKR
jgi:hypothetical protein